MTTAAKMFQEATEKFQDATEKFMDMTDDAQRGLGRGAKQVSSVVKHHPLATIAIGVGVGYLAARILHRG